MERNESVRIDALREVVNRILDFIEKDLGRPEVPLTANFYWSLDERTLYSMDRQPEQLDCGSLIDDWEFVRSAFDHPHQSIPLTLLHVAPLLRMLATAVPSYRSEPKRSD